MVKRHYNITLAWIERNRFSLLLLSTVLTMVLPAFSGAGLLSEIIFVVSLSFLFVQSMVVANVGKSKKRWLRAIVIFMILVSWLEPIGLESNYIQVIKLAFFVAFFIFVITYLIKFVAKSTSVNLNVLITSINIYLLAGIIGASLSLVCYRIYPDAYNFPAYIGNPVFVNFLYYSFITMSTVGYGDITPRIPETQTLAYILSVAGQLYMAIVIAMLIGKFLMQSNQKKEDQNSDSN